MSQFADTANCGFRFEDDCYCLKICLLTDRYYYVVPIKITLAPLSYRFALKQMNYVITFSTSPMTKAKRKLNTINVKCKARTLSI